ncbi:DUF4928 family protein [Persicitalea sp.]|uniref:DUF4928 family protein n=1 Tax=Persicitalea sp. TaxID=3100273 RepID=UPI0035941C07
MQKTYFDIFTGIGLVDYALVPNDWHLSFALDYEQKKFQIFESHFNGLSDRYSVKDIFELKASELPSTFLGHASFPCTDISAAGRRKGIQNGKESSAIDSLLGALYAKNEEERPSVMLTENVKGLLKSNNGLDVRYLLQHFNKLGYSNDLLLIDAKHFVPQSRERVFIISLKKGINTKNIIQDEVFETWSRPKSVIDVIKKNSDLSWSFLTDRPLPLSNITLESIIDKTDKIFWDQERTNYLFSQMSTKHQEWIKSRKKKEQYFYGTAFRRMRIRDGIKQSTAEIRVDQLAGCLRTAKGGSAKQILIRVGRGEFNVRLINAKEAAHLMGAPKFNISPKHSLNDYLFGFGDGVCSSVISWLDSNYLTPLHEANKNIKNKSTITSNLMQELPKNIEDNISKLFEDWSESHMDTHSGLPIRGRLYGALVVLHNFLSSSENEPWGFENTLAVDSTDKGEHFGDRSIKNHTSHKINLALSTLGRADLIPKSGGEAGRTSTGTKRAGLDMIKIVNSVVYNAPNSLLREYGLASVRVLNNLVLNKLDEHEALGGIEVNYSSNETIGSFISKIINTSSSNSGAILQHLVGAKLELRYRNNSNVIVSHNKASTADFQTKRRGDFDLGNSVIHVTKSPNLDHFTKALENAKSGRTTYLLIPSDRMGISDLTKDLDPSYRSKVNIYSIEQFISQNLDELSEFKREISINNLEILLKKYNELIDIYENDSSLKIVIPDFGN